MVNYALIQHKIDLGLRHCAAKLGWTHDAYRIESSSTGDFPTGWTQLGTGILLFRRKSQNLSNVQLESAVISDGTFWYDMLFDAEPYLLGDVFVSTDPAYVAAQSYGAGATIIQGTTFQMNAVAMAWHRPVMKPIGARIDRRCQIYRPAGTPYTMYDGTLRWSMTENDGLPLQLTNGAYAFGSMGETASYVPIGMGSRDRPSRGKNFQPPTPGVTGSTYWYGYIPYLPGYEPTEGDMVRTEDGARYFIFNPYEQEAGVVGSQLLLERVVSQDA